MPKEQPLAFVIVNNNMRQAPYWQTPGLYRDKVTGDWRMVGGWERTPSWATKYDSQTEAESVIAIRGLDATPQRA